jgi:hemolysin activation/secretion protein
MSKQFSTLALACLVPVLAAVVPAAVFAAAEDQPATTRFDVWEYQVEGADKLETTVIERVVYPHLGPQRSIEDVETARDRLETAFRDAGFGTVLVNIPEQDVENGVVRLEVIEGRVERLRIKGSRYFSLGRIRERIPALAEGEVPHLPEVQEQLAALNRATPDRRIVPVLRPGRRTGAVDVDLEVEDALPLHGSVELNDQFTRDTTRTRLNLALRYDNLWQREHSIGVAWQMTPQDPNEVKVLSGTYLMRPAWTKALVALYAVKSDSEVLTLGATGGGIGVLGKGFITGARFVRPLPAVGRLFHNLTVGLDYKDFEDTIAPQDDDGFVTPVSYTKFVAGWGGIANFQRAALNYSLEANFGARAFGNTEKEFENKRFQGKPNFVYLRLDSGLEVPIVAGTDLVLAFGGQIASGAIIGNEQFSLGGINSVRGYVETQVLVDDAVQGSVKVRAPSVARYTHADWISDLRAFLFADAGYGRIIDVLPGQPDEHTLTSLGLGFDLAMAGGVDSSLLWAWPLTRNGDIRPGESRLHFGVAYEF